MARQGHEGGVTDSDCCPHHARPNGRSFSCYFFFNDTATTEIYTLSLHDALPILPHPSRVASSHSGSTPSWVKVKSQDRKSTRLNSSHGSISYAVFCLKKKNK